MIRLSTLLHARRLAATDQGGFALAAVLAVIAFTGITIAALLGMMLTTMRVTRSQEEAAQDRRAADGAIENAIEKMRDVPCNPLAQPYLDDQQIGTRTVDVTCTSSTSGVSTTDQVRLVGPQGYNGAYRGWSVDCASNATAPGCLPWNDAGTSPAGATVADVSLVHSGNDALRFDSGVTVRRGAVALRNPTSGTPAIELGGEYNQGRPGIGVTSGTDCGILASLPAARIVDSSGAPTCGSPEAANLQAGPTNVAGLVPPITPVSVPSGCSPLSPVVAIQPGVYNAEQTLRLSELTAANRFSAATNDFTVPIAGCQNKTFWFQPGIYSFQGRELRFSSPGSYYVFGVPQGWDPATGVQGNAALVNDPSSVLCDPDVSGTSIITAGWTRLTHRLGRVAICPARPASDPDNAHPAIFQQTSVPSEVTITGPPVVGDLPSLNFTCQAFTSDYDAYGRCFPVRQYDLNLQTGGAAPVSSLRVMLTGTEPGTPNNLITDRETRFVVYRQNNALLCDTEWTDGMPNGELTSSFDLKTMPGTCASTNIDQQQLNGARIRVQHRILFSCCPGTSQRLRVDDAAVEVNAHQGWADSADVSSSDWDDPGAVARPDNSTASPVMPCNDFVCPVADPGHTIMVATPFNHSLEIDDFDFPSLVSTPDQDPLITGLRVVVRVRPSAATLPSSWTSLFGNLINSASFRMPTTSYLELESPSGRRCIVQGDGMNSDQ